MTAVFLRFKHPAKHLADRRIVVRDKDRSYQAIIKAAAQSNVDTWLGV
jgi:hypothetical protein